MPEVVRRRSGAGVDARSFRRVHGERVAFREPTTCRAEGVVHRIGEGKAVSIIELGGVSVNRK